MGKAILKQGVGELLSPLRTLTSIFMHSFSHLQAPYSHYPIAYVFAFSTTSLQPYSCQYRCSIDLTANTVGRLPALRRPASVHAGE